MTGGGCQDTRSTGLRDEWKQEAPPVGAFPDPSPQVLKPRRVTWKHPEDQQPLPDVAEIWDALQSIDPGKWRQELVQRLLEPVQEDGIWSAPELAEEMELFQAISKDLLQDRARLAPHRQVLSILAAHGTNRLLQVALGSCLPRTTADNTQQQEALADFLMQILHNLVQVLQEQEASHPLAMETPLISIYVHRVNSSTMGKMQLSFPGNPPDVASVILPEQSAVDALVPPGTPLHVQMVSFLGSPFPTSVAQTVTGTVAELNLLSGDAKIGISNLSAPVQIFLPQRMAAVFAPAVHISSGEALLLRVNITQTEASLLIHAVSEPKGPLKLFLQSPPHPDAVEPRAEQGHYTWLVGPEDFSTQEGQPSCFLMVPSSPSAPDGITLHVTTYGVQCVSWHNPSFQWRDEGCLVGPQSSLAQGHCLCSHLSFFGSSFWVVPMQVDVVRTAEYFGQVTKNPILALLLGALYALYLPGVAWARWMDVRDRHRVRPTVLPSDDPCAQYCYLLRIGLPGLQSPRVVCIHLRGSWGDSQAHQLPAGASVFLLREPWPLGELQSIRLWQDQVGEQEQPPQYITHATVLDLQQEACTHFPCETWLTPAKNGPSTPQSFSATSQQQQCMTFWALFRQRTLRGLLEEHTLLVVLKPPTHTHFTRVQRLSCGLCLLLCSALISLMFWEVPTHESPLILNLGSFSLSWKDIMVGVESALMTFPINLLVVFIFRYTKPRRNSRSSQAAIKPSVPTSLDNVFQTLCMAVQALSTVQKLPGLAVLQQSWKPEVDMDRLLQQLAYFVHLDPEAKEHNSAAEPRILCAEPSSPDSHHQAYCAQYLVLKLAHVARLLEELGSGAEALQKQVQEAAEVLARRLPVNLRSPRPRWRLPWWGLLVGWGLLVSLSATSTFFILLYGFQYGKESSLRWLLATAISFGQSIFVLQPFKVIACAIFCILILKREDSSDEMAFDLEE